MQAAGVDQIRERLAEDGLRAGVAASLEVTLGRIAAAMERTDRHRRQLAASITYIPGRVFPSFAGSALTAGVQPGHGFGPTPGYWWAIQGMRVAGLAATTDFLNVSRGNAVPVQPGNALHTFTIPVAGAFADWLPGGGGLLLDGNGQASLLFTGTSAATAITVSMDVIQVTDAQLPYYLM